MSMCLDDSRTRLDKRVSKPHFGEVEMRFFARVIAFGCLMLALLCATHEVSSQERDVLNLAREAALAARTGLDTGSSEGTYRQYDGYGKLVKNVRFRAVFDGDKEHYDLALLPGDDGQPPHDHRRIVVRDGSETFLGRFSKHLRKTGGEGAVYDKTVLNSATKSLKDSIREMVGGLLPLEEMEEYEVDVKKLSGGHYLGTYEVTPEDNYGVTFEVAPDLAYNVVSRTNLGGPTDKQSGQKFFADWKKGGDRWYVSRVVEEMYEEGALVWRTETVLTTFEPNVPISPDLFTLNALELPPGSRIHDLRPPEGPRLADSGKPIQYTPKIYRLPDTEGKIEQQRADRLVEQVEAMPLLYQREQVRSAWGLRIWGLAIGLLGIAAIAIVWFIQKRKAA